MATQCVRSITFTIPGADQGPAVQVKATEVNGSIAFAVDVLAAASQTADLRGLFFNFNEDAKLAGLNYSGANVTNFDTVNVIDLGHGVNMHGAANPFDVGLAFGTPGTGRDDIQSASFTLSRPGNNLTLDDIANVQFGARLTSVDAPAGHRDDSSKLIVTAPAAPDARDDGYTIFEDGQAGLDSPSHTPAGTLFAVLANDTDADGNTLSVTEVHGALHGTVQIVDGADADALPGDALQYTPFADYSGADSFEYCITDSHGGTDFAAVNVGVTAVADTPNLNYQVIAGPTAEQIIIRVSTAQTDADSSEFIDRIELSGIPAGVAVDMAGVNPAGEPDQIVQDFLLTLPPGQDTNFLLGIKAVAKETSNGDEASATLGLPIKLEYNFNDLDTTFSAVNQSQWDSGDQFSFTDDRFLGIDTSWNSYGGGFLYGATDGHLKAGFQSTLNFQGGAVDSLLPYDINVATTYNKTTDVLRLNSDAALKPGGNFSTTGPGGSYSLDFIFDFLLHARAGLDFGALGTWDIFSTTIGPWQVNQNLLSVTSDDLSVHTPLPAGFSLSFAWPDIDTVSNPSGGNTFSANGVSNNFLALGLDVDRLLFTLLGLPNPLELGFDIGVASGSLELLDLDLSAGVNLQQHFSLSANGLPGVIAYENGTVHPFTFGSDIVLDNASAYDTNANGLVEFNLALDPSVSFSNQTDLGFNFGYIFDVLKLSGSYDVIFASGSLSLGPLFRLADTIPIGTVGVYHNDFALDFNAQNLAFAA